MNIMVSWDMLTARRSASTNDIIHDMSGTIYELIQEANHDKYHPAKSYLIFDEDDAECYGVNPDKHHDVSQECIENYIWLIFENTKMERECLIPSILYLQKLLDTRPKSFQTKLKMYCKNWKTLVGMSMLISVKVWDDFHVDNASFLTFMYCMDLQRCNKLEVLYLKMIDFDVSVTKITYMEYEESILCKKSVRVSLSVKKPRNSGDEAADASTVSLSTGSSESTLMTVFTNDPTQDDDSYGYEKENEISPNKKQMQQHKNSNLYSVKMKTNRINNLLSSKTVNSYQLQCNSYSDFLSTSDASSPMSVLSKIKSAVRILLPFARANSAKVSLSSF